MSPLTENGFLPSKEYSDRKKTIEETHFTVVQAKEIMQLIKSRISENLSFFVVVELMPNFRDFMQPFFVAQLLDGSPRGGKNDVLSRMKQTYDDQTRKLEARLQELKAQLAAAYGGIQASSTKAAEQMAVGDFGNFSKKNQKKKDCLACFQIIVLDNFKHVLKCADHFDHDSF